MVSAFTTAAFHWAASAKRYPDLGPTHHCDRLFVRSASFYLPERPAPMPIPWTLALDVRSVMKLQIEAFRQHKSQAPLMEKTKHIFEELGHFEHYTLVAARDPQPASQFTHMFEGL
jgi:LmbE family N-acetylglucosaminyl deacetylase